MQKNLQTDLVLLLVVAARAKATQNVLARVALGVVTRVALVTSVVLVSGLVEEVELEEKGLLGQRVFLLFGIWVLTSIQVLKKSFEGDVMKTRVVLVGKVVKVVKVVLVGSSGKQVQ